MMGASFSPPAASAFMAATASASVMVRKKSMQGSRKRHASGDVLPQASPAITESTDPVASAA